MTKHCSLWTESVKLNLSLLVQMFSMGRWSFRIIFLRHQRPDLGSRFGVGSKQLLFHLTTEFPSRSFSLCPCDQHQTSVELPGAENAHIVRRPIRKSSLNQTSCTFVDVNFRPQLCTTQTYHKLWDCESMVFCWLSFTRYQYILDKRLFFTALRRRTATSTILKCDSGDWCQSRKAVWQHKVPKIFKIQLKLEHIYIF